MTALVPVDAQAGIRVGGPYSCHVCGASSADELLDPIFDSKVDGFLKWACRGLFGCLERAKAARAGSGGSEPVQ